MRMLAGPTCDADMRKKGGKIHDKTRVARLRPWRMLAGPTRDADMRQGGNVDVRHASPDETNGRCPDQPWATAAAI